MQDPIELKAGDPCPNCQGELKPAPVPTDEQAAKARDRENPIVLARQFDTATAEQRAELGALHRCATCGYEARFKADGDGGKRSRGKTRE